VTLLPHEEDSGVSVEEEDTLELGALVKVPVEVDVPVLSVELGLGVDCDVSEMKPIAATMSTTLMIRVAADAPIPAL